MLAKVWIAHKFVVCMYACVQVYVLGCPLVLVLGREEGVGSWNKI